MDAVPSRHQRIAMERLCAKVTRIGHSSSLVQMWVEQDPPTCNMEPADIGEQRLRLVTAGTLEYLASMFNRDDIEAYAELTDRINSAKGPEKKKLEEELVQRFGEREPVCLRPTISQWQAYRRTGDAASAPSIASGAFDRELIVLTIQEGPVIGLESTWRILTALQKTILTKCDPAPEWLSGHTGDEKPSQHPHVALFPLAFVGQEHADGHLMGVALALPKGIAPRERGRALRGLIYDEKGLPKPVELKAGTLGAWTLVRETRSSLPSNLQGRTWTEPSDIWATVTPIVLDRHPKVERCKDRYNWSLEVAQIIAESCTRQGLPEPVTVDVDKTSWHRGAPRAVGGKSAGYPLMPVKEGQTARQQVHAWIRFSQPVEGPLLLGVGRYRGYGLCRPWKGCVDCPERSVCSTSFRCYGLCRPWKGER
jgi:CRISPR-associated protein Csb2